ncbi:Asparagine synthase, partial [Rhizoctonia solani]
MDVEDSLVNPTSAVMDLFLLGMERYAFTYLHKPSRTLHFARDPLGQRSLLLHLPTPSEPIFFLCSASSHRGIKYEEISTDGIYSISLKGNIFECVQSLTFTPRSNSVFDGWKTLNREMPSKTSSPLSLEQIDDFISQLDNSVRSRVENIPSNNVDLLQDQKPVARLGVLFSGGIDSAIVAYLADRYIPRDEPIDLLNVGFENPRTLSASQNQAVQEARAQVKRDKKERKKSTHAPETPAKPPVLSVDRFPKMGTYDVPDRLTGLEQLDELRRLCPHRRWNFVCVNVPYDECKQEEPRVTALMHPSNTVMDLSLANALYFASRGKGVIYGSEEDVYVTPAKLQLDLDRLPARNLGRDDRVISANGRESRYPFLSLVLVSYLAQLPVQIKVDPRLARQEEGLGAGLGDKTLLRLAAERLGLVLASRRTKRAMQFGSRSARMDNGTSEKKGHVVLE